jgi:MOSC domain-containing protein YiiM
MHHFGEDMTTGRIEDNRFIVEARHHVTQAVIQMTGPRQACFRTQTRQSTPRSSITSRESLRTFYG